MEQSASLNDDTVLSVERLVLHLLSRGEKLKVVDDVSFEIKRGEFFALVGESGSGKTVIARSIMRLYPRSFLRIEGALQLEGVDLVAAEERTLQKLRGARMSMIFQEPMSSLNPLMTVEVQISETLQIHNKTVSRKEQRERVPGTAIECPVSQTRASGENVSVRNERRNASARDDRDGVSK